MSYEEEFDKIIRQKAGEADYPFDESNWVKTSKMIDTERALGRRAFWKKLYVPGAVVVATGVVGLIAFNYFTDNSSISMKKEIATGKNATQYASQKMSAEELTVQKTALTPAISSARNESTSTANITLNNSVKKTNNKENADNYSSAGSSNNANAGTLSAKQKYADNKTTGIVPAVKKNNKQAIREEQLALPADNSKTKSDGASTDNDSRDETINETNSVSTLDGSQDLEKNTGVASGNEVEGSSETPVNNNVEGNENSGQFVEAIVAENLLARSVLFPVVIADAELLPSTLVVLSRYDDDYVRQLIRHYVNVEAGGSYLLGWQSAKGTDAAGLNWFGGINYRYQLCDKTSFGLGFQVSRIANITQPFHSTYKTEYSFGSSRTYSEITAKELYYFSIPVRINYHLNQSNYFGLGLNAGYLISARNETRTYSANDAAPINKVESSEVFENLNTTNLMGSVYYNVSLTNRLSVNAEFLYGFTDLFKNTGAFKYEEKPVGVRLSLHYNIFNR